MVTPLFRLDMQDFYEMCVRMLGKSHTDPAARPFAMQVMQKLNDKCEEWKKQRISAILYTEHRWNLPHTSLRNVCRSVSESFRA